MPRSWAPEALSFWFGVKGLHLWCGHSPGAGRLLGAPSVKIMSNDHALLSIVEEAGKRPDMRGVAGRAITNSAGHCRLLTQ